MANKKNNQQEYIDLLNTVATTVTKKVLTPEYSHLLELWKALLGGFIGPEMAKLTPDAIDEKRKAMMEKYSKEVIAQMINPEPKVIEKTVEKIVYRDRTVSEPTLAPHGNDTGNRRYRSSVNRKRRKKRELQPDERLAIITLFNQKQCLMDKNDDACAQLTAKLNASATEPTSNLQVAGYWSWLCRVVLKTQNEQDNWFKAATRKGSLPQGCPMPVANDEFKNLIIENQQEQQALDAHRQAYKRHMSGAPGVQKPSRITF